MESRDLEVGKKYYFVTIYDSSHNFDNYFITNCSILILNNERIISKRVTTR
jgi:hypothetical protein